MSIKFTCREAMTPKIQEKLDSLKRISETKCNPKYIAHILSPEWEKLRLSVWKRGGFKCVRCGSKKGIQVHHLTYENLGHEKLEDLETLCNECHKKEHNGQ